ncbi:MAG: hypothetical protein IKD55_03345 [Sediminibacterium sp.]|nr:hypothetical protein [Sediminibacterium sp.]MBX9781159.1 hypothetical protein [Chitinophagaceae bacterium]
MKVITTLLLLFIGILTVPAQNITGIWRGYFSSSNSMYRDASPAEMYKYEVQILQDENTSIKGVTFSYKTTIFYGKASAQGIYNVKSKTLLLKETGLLDLKIGGKSEPCLMTCYLDYSKIGKLEVLQGTFISVNIKNKGDCGSGTVYLEKVPSSDFKKEDFLDKKKEVPKKDTVKEETKTAVSTPPVKKVEPPQAASALPTPVTPKSKLVTPSKQKQQQPKPVDNSVSPALAPHKEEKTEQAQKSTSTEVLTTEKKKAPTPRVLRERENNLVKTIITDQEFVQVDLFDNGTIDNDTISVYHNNELVVKSAKLNTTPISLKIRNTATDRLHELVIVAENLGEIPPNTALMVVTAGRKRYEIFLSSTEEKNAKVIIEYQRN